MGDVKNEVLLELCGKGDEKAWASFIERFAPLVFWAIRDKISRDLKRVNKDDVEDIFQQTLIQVWQKNRLKGVKSPKSLSSWLVIVAQNTAADFIRKKRSAYRFQAAEDLPEKIAPQSSNPRTETDNKQMYETVEKLIEDLPIKEQRIMTLELFYDFKHKEIAKVMDMPLNTVSTVISRIKKDLKAKLKRRGYDA